MSYVRPNYHKPGYPVLAYHYAMYCDSMFSQTEFQRWLAEGALDGSYRGHLLPYVADERPFPAEAEARAVIEVAAGGDHELHHLPDREEPSIRYRPTWSMAARQSVHILRECTGEAPAPGFRRVRDDGVPTEPREAMLNATYPLLSTLAVMFLAGDKSSWNTYGFNRSVDAVLERFANGEPVTGEQARPLISVLADEFSKPPAVW